ncbi:hypothetical protein SBOR_9173 [Sclerotinia borealis F-4128]|uniref:Copper homeostasis protein cutC homolog n=1 Tax=Sclerotinia borealis (strain F-4128) TaxID=1432307 RepID=W9C424_SCLBF|nr:hypothetical protein SBOR_9173 [Sclerotinia borealis F-4128]
MPPTLEIATFTPSFALHALASGASRIELCSHRNEDGLTPSIQEFLEVKRGVASLRLEESDDYDDTKNDDTPETLDARKENKKNIKSKINIMIRPHDNSHPGAGANEDFRVGNEVFEKMKEEIRIFRGEGAQGFVFGILMDDHEGGSVEEFGDGDGDGNGDGKGRLVVDKERCAELIKIAREGEDGEKLISLNFTALLTSGGAPCALDGIPQIAGLVQQAAGRIDVIVGGGVRSRNVRKLVKMTGAGWFHSSAANGDGEEVSGDEVRRLRYILDSWEMLRD